MSAILTSSDNGTYKGGYEISHIPLIGGETEGIFGGNGKKRFKNKVIPLGLAMKRIKPQLNHECKNGDILNNDIFEKLFNMVATVNKKDKKNTTRKLHKK